MSEQQSYQIGLLEDDVDLALAMAADIAADPQLRIGFVAHTLADAIAAVRQSPVDLCLVDLNLPDGNGVDFILGLRANSATKALILTVLGDRASVLTALQAGADGYLLKDISPKELQHHIRQTLSGKTPISPQAATYLLQLVQPDRTSLPTKTFPAPSLTPREVSVLQFFSRGLSYREAAAALDISPHTVGDHVKAIYGKLGVHSRSEAVFEARQFGLLHPSD
jgi:DNA-binding NarL/FixJ family response regulator